ncbi:MAG UNVERIFIED_CONTAM: hypothetical protein LVR18_49550 [Planctomycetaceae bacterium]
MTTAISPSQQNRQVVVAITGASGALYAVRLLQVLLEAGSTVHLVVSQRRPAGLRSGTGHRTSLRRRGQHRMAQPDPGNHLRRIRVATGTFAHSNPSPVPHTTPEHSFSMAPLITPAPSPAAPASPMA